MRSLNVWRLVKVLLLLLIYNSFAFSQKNYYISSSEGNDNNDGLSPASSWKTIDKLNASWAIIKPGDSILFKRGDVFAPPNTSGGSNGLIRPPVNFSGEPNKYIVIGAYGTGPKPIISSQNMPSVYQRLIYLRGGAYIIIQDLDFRFYTTTTNVGSGYARFESMDYNVGLHDIKILRCDFDFTYSYSDWSGLTFLNNFDASLSTVQLPYPNGAGVAYQIPNKAYPIYNIEIGYCVFRNKFTGNDMINIAAPDSNIYFHHNMIFNLKPANEGLDIGGGSGHIIENNIISGIGGAGIKLHSQYNLFKNSIIRGNLIVRCGGDNGTDAAVLFQNVENCQFYNNTLVGRYSITLGDRDRWAPYGYFGTFKDNKIFNNLFIGIIQVIGVWNNVVKNITINNQFYNNLYFPSGTSRGIDLKYTTSPDNYMVQRYWDIIDNPLNSYEPQYKVGTKVYIGENFSSFWKTKTNNSEIDLDPLFVKPIWNSPEDFGDWRIKENSPAYKTGAKVFDYLKDFYGNKVLETPNRGAFQPITLNQTEEDFKITEAKFSNQNEIRLSFNYDVDVSSCQNLNNYSFEPEIKIFSIKFNSSKNLSLFVQNPNFYSNVALKVRNLKSVSGKLISSEDNSLNVENSYKDQNSWLCELNISNQYQETQKLFLGAQYNATDNKDVEFGEIELPPPPPNPSLWVNFVLSDNSNVSYDIRNSNVEYAVWTLKLSGYSPFNLKWNIKFYPENMSLFLVDPIDGSLINIDMKKDSSYTLVAPFQYLKIVYKKLTAKEIYAQTGWNLISMPLEPYEKQADKLFAKNAQSKLYAYSKNGYYILDTLKPGVGFWAKFDSISAINIKGFNIDQPKTKVQKGWNLIGFSKETSVLNIQSNPPSIIESMVFTFEDVYIQAEELKPGRGYWIKTNSDGELFLSINKTNEKTKKIYSDYNLSGLPKIIFEDARNRKIELYFSNDLCESEAAFLPPLPPSNVFDIRYEGDKRIAKLNASTYATLTGIEFPVKISCDGVSISLSDPINGSYFNQNLDDNREIVLSDYPFNKIAITSFEKNYSFKLYQNYPNPFNSRTIISFELPKKDRASIEIYNILGERIKVLTNREYPAGLHKIEFDAMDLASGTYIIVLKTSSYFTARKMTLIK